ncbi:hypothetical protein [Hyalangium rubrum]|uniref:Peptidase M61 catalytic domain-containing protein n=1 Tax=Hyalangium rubrum TaxID=3103134 RepID=A0ABU5H925_9BACT|nr:hypothetical protein [Hyalangium sp. s54d21]MDY7229741.1 hypothetical protein [Hyalangium sp. s54d21]
MSGVLRLCLVALAVGMCSCRPEVLRAPRPSVDPAALRYNVTYVREPEHALDVEVVLVRGTPRDFFFTRSGGVETVWAYSETGEEHELTVDRDGVRLPKDTRFLRYRFPMDALIRRRGPDFFAGMPQEDARLIAGRSWLIRPRVAPPDLLVELTVTGVNALLPWQRGPGGVYRLSAEDLVDSGFHGFGGRRCEVRLRDAVLQVAILGHMTHLKDKELCEWLRRTAEEVRTVRRAFPHPRITVLVYPVPNRKTADVFGMVMWSSPPSIALLVGQDAEPSDLVQDWVALHEMLHLTHPAILPRAPWISEGLATYFTEVAKSRSGRQSPEQSWQELITGFERGRRQAGGRTMEEMLEENAPPGIYWVGAYFALLLDVELRRHTGNQRQLDDVLELLATQGPTSTVSAYGAAVDAVAGRPLFNSLLSEKLRLPAFSGLERLLEELGVTTTPGGVKLQLARDSLLREALDGQRASSAQ